MPCPLFLGLTPGNPLKVCGPKERLGYAPSAAHLKMVCLSISAYTHCPMYKLKTTDWKEMKKWVRFFRQVIGFFY
jgi:hypothetical protein